MSGPWLVLVGLAAGVMAGLFGIGGGVVIVPVLVVFAGFTLVKATGTSLAAIVLPVGLLGVLAYHRARIIDVRASIYLALGLLTSVAAGAWLANTLPAGLMGKLYALFLLYVSWNFIDPVPRARRLLGREAALKPEPETPPRPGALVLYAIGLAAGVMAGLFGIGGGNIIVPLLILVLGYPAKRAIATSLGALLAPVGLPGVLYYYQAGTLDLGAAAWVAAGLFLGTVFGARITIRLPAPTVKLLYGLFLLLVAARLALAAVSI
ncbi:MAG: sulfite exporter TauE/SafE family protein [Candidatus Aminicenantes bacterium]|nr:sulfite exporter TauE/SafE family protein [Candidatus Aminicenantes bacterium]